MFYRNAIVQVFFLHVINFISATEWNTHDYTKREHSLLKPYSTAGLNIPYWDFMGDTMVTNDFIRITPDRQSQSGSLWNSVPVNIRNWEVQVQFQVHGQGRDLFGDGFVIWYAKERMQAGTVFGSKNYFNGLAIIVDTYSNHNGPHNHQHPYISAMINNGSLKYDHDLDGTHTQMAGCEVKLRNLDYDTHISIKYDKDVLTVSTDISNKAAWQECFSVSGVKLPTGYHFGISASTGDLSDNHDVFSIRTYQLDQSDDLLNEEDRSQISPSATFFEPPRDHVDDPKPSSLSGFKLFLLMLVGALAIIACIVIGIMFYQQQQQTRKRLY